ncbi:hypothetical protein CANCADRAFT_15315, partial [Tortispora caseinolytica NRRL Y-17796]
IDKKPDNLSESEYHQLSGATLESICDDIEQFIETYPSIDCEYSQGILTIDLSGVGTYVVNKQPPNKQIWLSSPISGPNRYDLINGEWKSLRDGSNLLDVLNKEISESTGTEFSLN